MSTFLFTNNFQTGGGPVPSFVFTVQPKDVTGSRTGPGGVQSSFTFLNVSGGTPPYTFLWEHVLGSVFAVTNTNSSSTGFYTFINDPPAFYQGFYQCKVTDSSSPPVSITSNTIVVDLYATSTENVQPF